MYFRSTVQRTSRGGGVSFKEAVLRCLPEEGGLYVPQSAPDLRPFFLHMGEETTYPELTAAITPLLFEGELNPLSAARVAESAFTFEPELVRLDETFSVLKLYNGPTGVFKDFGVSFLAALLEELQGESRAAPGQGASRMVISAARGNTGVTIARAFAERRGIITTLLYPDEKIYGLDSARYVPAGGNLIPIRVKGTLDDCQRLVGEVIRDRAFAERYRITSGNAINPGRLLPQSFYFLYSFIKLKKRLSGELLFSIPSGNFGNLIAALSAWEFGMPVNGYIAAMNVNNSFAGFDPARGIDRDVRRPLLTTISPALDVSYPSNYERLAAFYQSAPAVMRNMVFPEKVDDESALRAMRRAWRDYRLHLDPHGALALAAAERIAAGADFNGHIVVLATAHPAQYGDLAHGVSGEHLPLPEKLASLAREAQPMAEIEPALEGLESAITACF
jgi:threonine synthase